MFRLIASAIIALAVHSTFAQEPARAEQSHLKGVELYSWKDERSGEWRFSLLLGTNRIKSLAEIKSQATVIRDIVALKQNICRLARGENVYWYSGLRSNPTLQKPDHAPVDEVIKFAAGCQVTVVVAQ